MRSAGRAVAGTADESASLEAADSLLAPFYETVFRCYLRRCRGEGEVPALEPPSQIRPFLRFKPGEAARQPQVRAVLRDALRADSELREMCAQGVGEAESDTEADALRLVESGDVRGLANLVSRAALQRHAGWDTVVWIGAAAAAAEVRARAVDAEEHDTAMLAAASKEQQRRTKLVKAQEKAEAERDRTLTEIEELRRRYTDLRREAARLTRERDGACGDLENIRTALADAESAAGNLREDLAQVRRRERELTASFDRERRELQDRIRRLESMRVPDLEAPAAAIEAIAEQLRRTQADLAEAHRTVPAAGPGTGRALPGRRESRSPHPPGVSPGSRDALRWALRQPSFVILVDAYNVILEAQRGWPDMRGPEQRQLLLSRCEGMLPAGGAEMHVVFDSSEQSEGTPRRQHPRVRHEFAAGMTADDRLVEIAAGLPTEAKAYAVTSDRELRERLEACGVSSVSSEVFLDVAEAPRR